MRDAADNYTIKRERGDETNMTPWFVQTDDSECVHDRNFATKAQAQAFIDELKGRI